MDESSDTPELLRLRRDAEHLRKCAADTREVAQTISLVSARHRMEKIAKEYDRLAEQAERKVAQGR